MRKMEQGTNAIILLRDHILSGKLSAGERLLELALVEQLGISRTPIRHALARLADEGLLEKVGGGYAVREFTRQEIRDAIRLRGVVEGVAARTAAERGVRREVLRDARKCIDDLQEVLEAGSAKEVDIEAYLSINERFHAAIVELADSFVIQRTLGHICTLPFASPNAFVMARRETGDIWEVVFIAQQQHRSMLEAIESGEGARAEWIAREHAELSLTAMRLVLRAPQSVNQVPGMKLLIRSGT